MGLNPHFIFKLLVGVWVFLDLRWFNLKYFNDGAKAFTLEVKVKIITQHGGSKFLIYIHLFTLNVFSYSNSSFNALVISHRGGAGQKLK